MREAKLKCFNAICYLFLLIVGYLLFTKSYTHDQQKLQDEPYVVCLIMLVKEIQVYNDKLFMALFKWTENLGIFILLVKKASLARARITKFFKKWLAV